ncbi:MAG: Gfo/Idh/MocA family protein [Opitutaceae bacterium]
MAIPHPGPLRGLFCGAGHFARIQLDAWQEVSDARIVAIYNRTLERARQLQRELGIEAVSDNLEALLDSVRPDFVDICTAVETHLPLVRAAAARGLPILCQKPLAPRLAESERLVAISAEHGVRLMANDNWRWQGWYRELKRLLDAGTVGHPQHARFVMRPGDGGGEEPYPLQPFFRGMERFVLLETGIHYLDTLRFLFGPIKAVHCITRRRNPHIRGEDAAIVTLEFAGGMTAVYDADRTAVTAQVRPPVNGHAFIEGSAGNLRLAEDGSISITRRGHPEVRHDYAVPAGYRGGSVIAAQQHFVACLRSGAPFETEGRDYLAVERAVEACYRSAAHRTVESLAGSE